MRYVKWTLWGLVALIVLSFLHYTLPQTDIVRVVGTNTQRMDLGENSWFFSAPDSGTAVTADGNRDVKFIETVYPDGDVMVFRNEDTAWGWPPYFKFNSFDVQAEAQNRVSTEATPQWVAITHYGWRNQFFTIFPNAISITPATGPDQRVIPWVSITILVVLALILLLLRRMWLQFRERTIDPAISAVDAQADAAGAKARGLWSRWFGRKG
jgi:hypothetical protein